MSALITGCGKGGIGHAFTVELRGRGYEVFATLLPHEEDQHLKDAGARVIVSDVTKDVDVVALKELIQQATGGHLSILVNNAGICYTMTAADANMAEVEKMFAVNVLGPMRMVHHFHRMLIRSSGVIINIGSIGGIVPHVHNSAYNATKAALYHYGDTLRVEMAPLEVRVINIISGEVATNILDHDKRQKRKLPDGSVYAPLSREFEEFVSRVPPNRTKPEQYARAVIDEALKSSPAAWFWYGSLSSTVRWCDMLLPRTFWDFLLFRKFSLGKLQKANQVRMTDRGSDAPSVNNDEQSLVD
ncbi:hypothetical protein S40288_08038 [Stachybotrys chartarum IBT 40288]|nr:hypothetical protein S40288_08038 [Stachybotrys chartarum IBT 40288]